MAKPRKPPRTGKGSKARAIRLSERERAFALAWFELSVQRGTSKVGNDAYRRAFPTTTANDGTARKEAHKFLSQDHVQAFIQSLRDRAASAVVMSATEVLAELSRIGRADLRQAVRWGDLPVSVSEDGQTVTIPHGVSVVSSDKLDPDVAAAIAEVRETEHGIVIKLHDKVGALEKLGKYHKLFADRLEHSGGLTLTHEDALDELDELE